VELSGLKLSFEEKMQTSSRSERLRIALLSTGMISSVWHLADDGQVITAMCRAAGTEAGEKDKSMQQLAAYLLPKADGILIAKQFLIKDGRLVYTWNVSVFGENALCLIEGMAPIAPPINGAAPQQAVPKKTTNIQVVRDTRDGRGNGVRIEEFPLPHASQLRNRPSDGMVMGKLPPPLGHGKGAVWVEAENH
jgi:hypothetical protein